MDVIAWLLAGDPAIRWQVHRDLLSSPDDVVAAERAAVAVEGWGAALLARQDPDGRWGAALYSPKWTSTTYTLLLLRQLGLPAEHPAGLAGCLQLLDGARWYGGGLNLAKTVREPETCITALVVSLAAAFGAVDQRVDGAMGWLLDQQLADGGWNCETVRCGSRHGSFDTTILALEACEEWLASVDDDAVCAAGARGREFFLQHRLHRSHRTGEPVPGRYTELVFPTGWHHDVLRGLDHFQRAGAARDDRLDDAVALLRARQRPDGRWAGNRPHPGRQWFVLERAGQPSRVQTLRALRVLRWWEGAGVS